MYCMTLLRNNTYVNSFINMHVLLKQTRYTVSYRILVSVFFLYFFIIHFPIAAHMYASKFQSYSSFSACMQKCKNFILAMDTKLILQIYHSHEIRKNTCTVLRIDKMHLKEVTVQ